MRPLIPLIAGFVGALLVTIATVVLLIVLTEPTVDPFGDYCYTVIDHRGEAHPSKDEPNFIPGTEAYYATPKEMGIVMAPLVIRVNTECLEAAASEPNEDR